MIVYLVRHAESAFNAEGRIQGQTDVPLSDLGRRQAEALAAALAKKEIEAVFSSPLARAYETARPVAAVYGLDVVTDSRLVEIHAGIFQGLRFEEMKSRYPDAAARWAAADPDFVIPQGESRRQLMQRGQAALEDIFRQSYHRVVVVAHGGLLAAALKAIFGIPADRSPFRFYNAAISKLALESQPKLLTLNETEHLRSVDSNPTSRSAEL